MHSWRFKNWRSMAGHGSTASCSWDKQSHVKTSHWSKCDKAAWQNVMRQTMLLSACLQAFKICQTCIKTLWQHLQGCYWGNSLQHQLHVSAYILAQQQQRLSIACNVVECHTSMVKKQLSLMDLTLQLSHQQYCACGKHSCSQHCCRAAKLPVANPSPANMLHWFILVHSTRMLDRLSNLI